MYNFYVIPQRQIFLMKVPIVAYKLVSLNWKEEFLKSIILRSFTYNVWNINDGNVLCLNHP